MAVVPAQPNVTIFKDELTPLTPARYSILVPVANPSTADELLDLATSLARERKGEIVALHVLASANHFPGHEEQRSALARRTILEERVTSRRRTSVPIHTVTRIASTVAEGILETARTENHNLILLGWQGRIRPVSMGSSLGDVLDPVITMAPCPIAVVKNPTITSITSIQRILVPTAGGPNAALAIQMGLTLAKRHKALVTVLNVAKKGQEESARKMLERTVQQVKTRQVVRQEVVVSDHVVKALLREAKDYDVVILGASHEGVFQQLLFGVIPEQVAKRCPKTVIMVKGSAGPLRSGLRRLWSSWSSLRPTNQGGG